jgi:hypothetical protein
MQKVENHWHILQPVRFTFQLPYTLNAGLTCDNYPEHKSNKMGQNAVIIHAKRETTHQLFG